VEPRTITNRIETPLLACDDHIGKDDFLFLPFLGRCLDSTISVEHG
jgi:hypothetical protein